jgi:hypothetical protein
MMLRTYYKKEPLLKLEAFGQSIWMDFIRHGTISRVN